MARRGLAPPRASGYIAVMLSPDPLKLLAFDEEDLAVISAHLQEARLRPVDAAYLPAERRFALVVDRFDWCGGAAGEPKRRRSGLHFERVSSARQTGLAPGGEAPATLIAVSFEAGQAPSGTVTLRFADGAAIRLDVECIEAAMRDLTPSWACEDAPALRA